MNTDAIRDILIPQAATSADIDVLDVAADVKADMLIAQSELMIEQAQRLMADIALAAARTRQ